MQNQSKLAIKFLNYYAKENGIEILHRNNSAGGEVKVNNISVDGYEIATSKIFEVNGCRWHACPKCYPRGNTVIFDGKNADEIRGRDAARLKRLNPQGTYEIITFWECEIEEMLRKDKVMKKEFSLMPDDSPINLRSALQGGRCGPMKLALNRIPGQQIIKHFDIVSLYPFICAFFQLPKMHPIIKTKSEPYQRVEDVPFGIIKAKVLPPINQKLPVLGVKKHSMLLFGNCNRCMENYGQPDPKNPARNVGKISCKCTDEQRSLVVTTTSEELKFAMRCGYVVEEVYHSLEYAHTSNKIFLPYIQDFLVLKTHASLPPPSFNTPEGKKNFVDLHKKLYGITIDPDKCAYNPGQRFIAKIFLNSAWGRFSYLANASEKDVINYNEYAELTKDEQIYDLTAIEIEENVLMATYKKDVNLVNASSTSLPISIFVTSYARLWLLRFLRQIEATPGCSVGYLDTDSVLCSCPSDDQVPIVSGDGLGSMMDEHPDEIIVSYKSGGAKNYMCTYRPKDGGRSRIVKKIRGLTATAATERLIGPMDFDYDPAKTIPIPTTNIGPSKDLNLYTTETSKNYRTICLKGIVWDNTVYEFGHRFDEPDYPIILTEDDDTDIERMIQKQNALQTV
uniref:DNA-directed DNA polymerase n=1 Tax=Panagrolaimus superbus TaxID=310955 RepID=A0A914YME9_9BILA